MNVAWSTAVGSDFAYPDTTGPKPPGTDLINRYMERVIVAGQHDDQVALRFNEVVAMVRKPDSLMAPRFMLRVLLTADEHEGWRSTGAPARGNAVSDTPKRRQSPRSAPRQPLHREDALDELHVERGVVPPGWLFGSCRPAGDVSRRGS